MTINYLYGTLAATFGIFMVFIIIIALAMVVLNIVGKWKVFKKAGKAGWEAIIPFYSDWILVQITGLKWWFIFFICFASLCSLLNISIGFASIISLAGAFFAHYNLAIKFDRDPVGYGIGLTLLPFIFYPLLGMSDAKYIDKKVSAYGPIKEETVTSNSTNTTNEENKKNNETNFCKNCGAEVNKEEKFCSKCGTKLH